MNINRRVTGVTFQSVSTRRVKKITTELCGREFGRQTVSRLAEGLDEQVTAWAERSLAEQSDPFLVLDGMHVKVRRQGAVRSTTAGACVRRWKQPSRGSSGSGVIPRHPSVHTSGAT